MRYQQLALLVISFSLTACAAMLPEYPRYDLRMASVERPANAKQQYGPEKLTTFTDSGKTKYQFDDSLVKVIVFPSADGFWFRVENKTSHSIRILWDDAAIVQTDGQSGRAMHQGVKYIDRNNSQPPSVIVAHGFLVDEAIPTANVSTSYGSGWHTEPMLPHPAMYRQDRESTMATLRGKYKGKSMQLLLPLQIENVTNDYLFTFAIDDVHGTRDPVTSATR